MRSRCAALRRALAVACMIELIGVRVKFSGVRFAEHLLRAVTPSIYAKHLREHLRQAFTPSIYANPDAKASAGWTPTQRAARHSRSRSPTASPASIAGYAHVDTARRLHARHGRNFCDAFALRPGRHAARISWHRVSCRKTCSAGDLTPCSPAVARRGRCIRARFERLRRLRQPSAPSTASVRARPP